MALGQVVYLSTVDDRGCCFNAVWDNVCFNAVWDNVCLTGVIIRDYYTHCGTRSCHPRINKRFKKKKIIFSITLYLSFSNYIHENYNTEAYTLSSQPPNSASGIIINCMTSMEIILHISAPNISIQNDRLQKAFSRFFTS